MSLSSILSQASSSVSFKQLEREVASSKKWISLCGVAGSGKALLVSWVYDISTSSILVITDKADEASTLVEDLENFVDRSKIHYFPAWEVLPYEWRVPRGEIIGTRLETLYQLLSNQKVLIVSSLRGLMEKTLPLATLKENIWNLKVGDKLELDILVGKLDELGFVRAVQVEEVGSYSSRGGILDVFPYSSSSPLRIELFEDKVESIREFSVLTQRSFKKVDSVLILPKREVLISDEKLESYLGGIDEHKAEKIREKIRFYDEVPGLEWLGSLLGINQSTLLDYLSPKDIILSDDMSSLKSEYDNILQETEGLCQQAEKKGEIVPSPLKLWNSWEEIKNNVVQHQLLEIKALRSKEGESLEFGMTEQEFFSGKMDFLKQRIEEYRKESRRVYIICENATQKERLAELLDELSLEVHFEIAILHKGFSFTLADLVVLTEHQIFSRYFRRRRKKRFKEGLALSSYTSLSIGDFVVHVDFGIGRYMGPETLLVDNKKRECLEIHYQDEDKLYVPIEEFNRVQKFVGKEGGPALSKLGGTAWERLKSRTKKAICDMTKELISLYAERKAKPGFAFSPDTRWQKELESSFIYEETPDQWETIKYVKRDMESPLPMDRLVCGDVGYGKTEVAVRAAFKCVTNGKQVAVLVPTTILAQQHLATFIERLSSFPIRVEMLSRFKTKPEQKKIVEDLKQGKVDIVIGTHKLLQKDVGFKDLGLFIVDEEQRFGVAHKEKLKKLRTQVDVLTLTATPIPRTMQLSLMGIRDMSLINTPPKYRLPIQTEIGKFEDELIADAILKEIDRGGQVYFVHNRVESIDSIYRYLKRILPQVRIAIAHGQMEESVLEEVMLSFLDRKYDLLLATSIIESGLDIPNVNTIIVNRADKFGLAQLYQLRGRVGRSNQKAYAYLLVPPFASLTESARKRIKALEQFTELGSGFHLAMRDLEIRGAGNILGAQQHGFIQEIGFDLYCKLLDEAIRELKGEKIEKLPEVKLDFDMDLYIPSKYIPDSEQRVEIYRKLASTQSPQKIEEIALEIEDRFGLLPLEVESLLEVVRIKLTAAKKGIVHLGLRGDILRIGFSKDRKIDKKQIEGFAKNIEYPLEFSVSGDFTIKLDLKGKEQKLEAVKNLLPHF
jgi:transcription-repair coupling factor (superfamily II helicase)